MMEELLIKKCINLKIKLQDIRSELLNLHDIHKKVDFELRSFLLVDNQILNFDDYFAIISIFDEIESEISNVFISMIDNNL